MERTLTELQAHVQSQDRAGLDYLLTDVMLWPVIHSQGETILRQQKALQLLGYLRGPDGEGWKPQAIQFLQECASNWQSLASERWR